jgi:hypothetical protein
MDPVPLDDVVAITFLGTDAIRKHPVLGSWELGSATEIDLDAMVTDEGTYSATSNLGGESWYPIVLGYKDSVSVGFRANFSDPVRLDTLSFRAAYSVDSELPSEERPNLSIEYKHTAFNASPLAGTWRFGAHLNYADFYDLFGPTKQSRKGQRYEIGYEKTLLYDDPRVLRFSTELSHHRDMDALPRYQNIPVTFDQMTTLYGDLQYEHVRRSLGAVDDEKGFKWSLAATINNVDGDIIPKIGAEFDFGFALPLKHSSIWFRNAAGAAFGEPDDEFSNFFFGGFGNNYVDRGEVKRYRNYYAMPGFELNAIPGRNFYRGMIEWNLPPIHFKRAGTPNFYLTWIRPAIFASSLDTNIDGDDFDGDNIDGDPIRIRAQNVGVQIDFQIKLKSRFDLTISTGYAKGWGDGDFEDDEFMISLKIM